MVDKSSMGQISPLLQILMQQGLLQGMNPGAAIGMGGLPAMMMQGGKDGALGGLLGMGAMGASGSDNPLSALGGLGMLGGGMSPFGALFGGGK